MHSYAMRSLCFLIVVSTPPATMFSRMLHGLTRLRRCVTATYFAPISRLSIAATVLTPVIIGIQYHDSVVVRHIDRYNVWSEAWRKATQMLPLHHQQSTPTKALNSAKVMLEPTDSTTQTEDEIYRIRAAREQLNKARRAARSLFVHGGLFVSLKIWPFFSFWQDRGGIEMYNAFWVRSALDAASAYSHKSKKERESLPKPDNWAAVFFLNKWAEDDFDEKKLVCWPLRNLVAKHIASSVSADDLVEVVQSVLTNAKTLPENSVKAKKIKDEIKEEFWYFAYALKYHGQNEETKKLKVYRAFD